MKKDALVITCVGLNHLTSPVEERERLAFTSDELHAAVASLGESLHCAVLLSTCNRTELYTLAPAASRGVGEASQLTTHNSQPIALLQSLKATAIDESHFYALQHEDALRHLFRVAAGIDSMVL